LSVAENRDANDDFVQFGPEAIRAAIAGARDTLPPFAPYNDPQEGALDDLPGICDPSQWAGKQPPQRDFIIPGWIIKGACGLLSGQEGVGKSLIAQQMATCAALGKVFLGLDIFQCPVIYITCEDPSDELWRRQADINKSLGVDMADLEGRLVLVSLKGQLGNELALFDQQGRISVTDRYRQIEALALGFNAKLLFLDNAAHLFTGNENARHDVAAFLGLLERLSEQMEGAVVLLAHPNKQHSQGNKQGNEYSGSTGWSAHVRNRLFIDWADKTDAGDFLGEDGRVLRKSKANYGKKGEEIYFRWHEWAFVRDDDLPPTIRREIQEVSKGNFENERFIACLRQRNSEKRPVSEQPASRTYAPKVFAEMPESKGCTKEQLSAAMDRLFKIKAIERRFLWVDKGEGKPRFGLIETDELTKMVSADLPLTSLENPLTSEGI
jgi:RecA-family ATPase